MLVDWGVAPTHPLHLHFDAKFADHNCIEEKCANFSLASHIWPKSHWNENSMRVSLNDASTWYILIYPPMMATGASIFHSEKCHQSERHNCVLNAFFCVVFSLVLRITMYRLIPYWSCSIKLETTRSPSTTVLQLPTIWVILS